MRNVKVVGYFTDYESKEVEAFEIAARHFQEDLSFGLITDSSLAKSFFQIFL